MWMKIVGAILTISSCTALGFYFSTEMNTRLKQLRELIKYITILRGDIRYANTPLPEAMENLARRSPGFFQEFLMGVTKMLYESGKGTFGSIWQVNVENCLNESSLTKTDKEQLIHFGENLGYLDKEMQVNTIDLYLHELEEETKELTNVAKERGRLYNLLGIMAGIFITIVMI